MWWGDSLPRIFPGNNGSVGGRAWVCRLVTCGRFFTFGRVSANEGVICYVFAFVRVSQAGRSSISSMGKSRAKFVDLGVWNITLHVGLG